MMCPLQQWPFHRVSWMRARPKARLRPPVRAAGRVKYETPARRQLPSRQDHVCRSSSPRSRQQPRWSDQRKMAKVWRSGPIRPYLEQCTVLNTPAISPVSTRIHSSKYVLELLAPAQDHAFWFFVDPLFNSTGNLVCASTRHHFNRIYQSIMRKTI